jgi:Leucine-rich repeat (LRR) protein
LEHFQRGLDPKSAMGIGSRALIKKWFDNLNIPPEDYVINPDLSIDYESYLDLSNTPITSLPDNLTVDGDLDLSNTKITNLPDNLRVNGGLYLSNTKITNLPDNLKVEGDLYIHKTNLKSVNLNIIKGDIYK